MTPTSPSQPSKSLSRQTVGLLLEMKRLLSRYDIEIKLNATDAIERMLSVSADMADIDIRECRERLLHATRPLDRLHLIKPGQDQIICDRCGHELSVSLSGQASFESPEQALCVCGKQLQVAMEPRKHPRKPTQLSGLYLYESDREQTGDMIVEDLSYEGIRMRLPDDHALARDDRLLIVFTLDDLSRSVISEPVQVRHVRDRVLGVQFVNTQTQNKALMTYLGS